MPEIAGRIIFYCSIMILFIIQTSAHAQFLTPYQYRLRQIMLIPGISEERDAEVLKKAEACLARAKAGEDFTTLAKKLSEEPGASHTGGDLGFFEHKAMVKPFSDVVFAMKPGEIAGPVKTQFGYHIIKLHGIDADKRHAQHILFMLTPGKADSLKTLADLEKAGKRIQSGEDFSQIIEDYPVENLIKNTEGYMVWQTTDNMLPSFIEAIKGLKQGEVSRPFVSIIGMHIVQVDSINYNKNVTLEGFPPAIAAKLNNN